MSAIGASNVAYALQGKMEVKENSFKKGLFTAIFGNGTLTYPAGGIPLSGLSSQGFPNLVQSVKIVDPGSANGLVYKYDSANNKIRIYQSAGLTPAGTVATHTHTIPAGTDAGGGTSGTTAPAFTGTAVAAGGLVELAGSATPAAATLYLEVVGY